MKPEIGGSPTLEEVARVAGVSRATASRVINGSSRVSEHALEAVQLAIAEVGYIPNRAARTLVTRRADSVALVIPETGDKFVGDPFLTGALQGVTAGLAGSEIQLVLLIAQQAGDTDRLMRYLRAGHVDGALVMSHHREDHLPVELVRTGLRCVFLGRPLGHGETSVRYVDADNVGGGRIAAEYLLSRGARRITTIAGAADMPAGVDRLVGWKESLEAAGRPADRVAFGDFTAEGGAAAMRALLASWADLDAVFIASDLMATGALRVLREAGRQVPDDVAVVGFDDSMLAPTTVPPLTTIRQDAEQLGRRAVELLLDQLHGDVSAGPEIMPTELIVRESA